MFMVIEHLLYQQKYDPIMYLMAVRLLYVLSLIGLIILQCAE